ncbi:MAG: dCMP deaminase family protein [Candidatus Riflebacteria bacterium]|nr:dCMP deaminase family protein [Candidatus Riflebacteria bacterium]
MGRAARLTVASSRQPVTSIPPTADPGIPIPGIKRPSWETYFMRIARLVATRSTCLRRRVGAVIVRENRILATGYNGAPSTLRHCFEIPGGCLREARGIPSGERQELCRGLHAEQNAILQAAAFGVSLKGGVVYCTHQPCVTCAKMLLNAGIEKVVFLGAYPDTLALEMLKEGKIQMERIQLEEDHVTDPD